MSLVQRVRRWLGGNEPTLVDYEAYAQQSPPGAISPPENPVLGKVGPAATSQTVGAGNYKIQQSYDSLLQTVQELRSALDGQARRQDELLTRLSALPQAAEALPQTSKIQADMLKMINDRLAMHAEQQRKVSEFAGSLGPAKKEHAEVLQSIREQIEMGNEIDRQLVESFNRFSMMIDRLQLANQHAVDALQQVRDSYAASAMQMHEWIEKSRHRNNWLIGGAFLLSLLAALLALIAVMNIPAPPGH